MRQALPGKRLHSLLLWCACVPALVVDAQITWRHAIGGTGADRAACVRQVADGGYIVAGSTGSFGHGSGDIYLIRLDADGGLSWSHTYGGPDVESGVSCRELVDGFVIAGTTFSGSNGSYDMVLIRTDMSGEVLWEKHFGTPYWDLCAAMDVVGDGFVLAGTTYGHGAWEGAAFVVRTDGEGEVLWTALSDAEGPTEGLGVTGTQDGGAIVTGSMATLEQQNDAFAMKLDADGGIEWTTVVGGAEDDVFNSAVQDADGSYAAIGSTKSWNPYMQILLVGFDANGGVEWQRDIGNTADASGSEVRIDHGGGYVFTGYNTLNQGERDMIFTVTDDQGWWQMGNNYGNGQPADGLSIDPTDDGGYVVAGWCEHYGTGPRSVYVVKTDANGQTADLTVITIADPLSVPTTSAPVHEGLLFPVPVARGGVLHVRTVSNERSLVLVHDSQGRLLGRSVLPAGAAFFPMPACGPGVHVATITSAGSTVRARIVVE